MNRRDSQQIRPAGGATAACGKRMYLTRDDAKRAARRVIAREGRLRAYRCGEAWHLGHLPSAVTSGDMARDDIEGPQ